MASSDANQVPTIDSWGDKDQQIQVAEGNGFLYKLSLRAKVDAKLDLIYKILVDPQAVDVFRGIKACTFRKVLEEDKVQRRRKLEVGHKAIAKFLCFTVNFETRLHVWEDDINRTIRFSTAKEGFMKKFEGSWHVQPFTDEILQRTRLPVPVPEPVQQPLPLYQQLHQQLRLPNPLSVLHSKLGIQQEQHTTALVTLEHAFLPNVPVPPGIKGVMRRLCAKQIRDMMEDLHVEIDKREARSDDALRKVAAKGKPTPNPVATAASMTLAQPQDIWSHITPIVITISL